MKKIQKLEKKVKSICNAKYKSGRRIFWKKDFFLDGKTLEEIKGYLNLTEERPSVRRHSKISESRKGIYYRIITFPYVENSNEPLLLQDYKVNSKKLVLK